MKKIIILLCLIQNLAFSQSKPIESKIYYWKDLVVNKRLQGELRPILNFVKFMPVRFCPKAE